jgi:hypothetical protein
LLAPAFREAKEKAPGYQEVDVLAFLEKPLYDVVVRDIAGCPSSLIPCGVCSSWRSSSTFGSIGSGGLYHDPDHGCECCVPHPQQLHPVCPLLID